MVALFDVNGTLTDPAGLGEPWGRPELGLVILRGAIHSSLIDVALGEYRPFSEHVRAAIKTEVAREGLEGGAAFVDAAGERAGHLDPFPDAAEALDRLRDAGFTLAALTNSGADAGRRTLHAAGLLDRFDQVLGVDAVHTFKPDGRTYAHAVAALGVTPGEIVMVAAHSWDLAGARHAGLHTAWIARGEGVFNAAYAEPDHRADDLRGIASTLVTELSG